jgi:protein-disulfide isomerase
LRPRAERKTPLLFPPVPSGKKSKEARRTAVLKPPPVQSKGAPRRREANPRVLAIGAAVVVLAAVGIGLAVVLSRGGSGIPKNLPTYGSLANGLPGAADVQAMYGGIPQKGLVLGKSSAPVRMVIFIDLQCPLCQQFELQSMPTIVDKYVRTGKVQVEVKPWAFIGPDSARGQAAMFAAAQQNKAFNFAQILYINQGTENTNWLTDDMVAQAAESIPGLNVHTLLNERKSGSVTTQVKAVAAAAQADKVSGTPTVFVGKTSAKKPGLVGKSGFVPTTTQVTQAFDAALAS